MFFVKRHGDYRIEDVALPDDDILGSFNDEPEFRRYVEEIKRICGDYKDCKFPSSYFGNVRPWDYLQILKYGNFNLEDVVLECGGLHSYFAIYLSTLVKHYTCTDNFYWAKRPYAKNPALQTPEEWCNYLISKGNGKLWAEEADIQALKYSDNTFDRVVCISVIEHVPQDRKGILEMMRVLKPGGTLLLTTEYNPTWSRVYEDTEASGYYRVYNDQDIDKLFEGLNVDKKEAHQFALPAGTYTTFFARIVK